jgi:hypothetical protein
MRVSIGDRTGYEGDGFCVTFDPRDPLGTLAGSAADEVDLTWASVARWVWDAVYASDAVSYPALCTGDD